MRLIILSLTFLIINDSYCQTSINSKKIDSLVQYSMNTMPQAGIAIGVVLDNEIVHLKGYGIRSSKDLKPVDEKTMFAIASNSKAFTTTALALLVDQGKIHWTDRVRDYIPEFRMYDPYVTDNFNIVDLLTHRSGLGLGAGDLMFFPDGADFTIHDVLNSFQYQEPVSAFRTKYDYDNLLYVVAGEIIHRVSGQSWDHFVESEIMKKLGMDNSYGIYQNIPDLGNTAAPHSIVDGKIKQIDPYTKKDGGLGAAGGIYSCVEDLCKWMKMHLNHGRYGENMEEELLSEGSHNELWKIHTNIFYSAEGTGYYKTHYRGYGLGFNLTDKNGYTIVQHSGLVPGMLSMVTMIPELDAGIVVLTNSAPGGYSYAMLTNEIIDDVTNGGDRDWIQYARIRLEQSGGEEDSVLTAVWNRVEESKKLKINTDRFTGKYKDDWFGMIEVYEKGGKLWFRSYRSPKLHGRMYFYNANTFVVDWDYDDMECDAFAMFQLDEEGFAQSIKMKGISPNIDFSFDFHDLDLYRTE